MSSKLKIKATVLDDLCSRFLLNIPQTEKEDMVRLCFQIELAHWFYLDFFRPEDPSLSDCRMKDFAKLIFAEYPFLLNPSNVDVDDVLERWKEYKRNVPTYGAILLDSALEHVLLVQGFWIKASWGFPKGKINKSENPDVCAAREVLEETGYDISKKIDKNQYAEHHLNEQLTRLYFVPGVPMDISFKPKTRGEIKNVQWFNVNDLPEHKKDQTPKQNLNIAPNCFFMVIPFVKQMKRWISSQKSTIEFDGKMVVKINSASDTTRAHSSERVNRSQSPSKSTPSKFSSSTGAFSKTGSSGRRMKQDDLQKIQHFGRCNNAELELLNSISKDVASNTTNRQQRNKGFGRAQTEQRGRRNEILPFSTNQGRGRILQNYYIPDVWKNFSFDRGALAKALSDFK